MFRFSLFVTSILIALALSKPVGAQEEPKKKDGPEFVPPAPKMIAPPPQMPTPIIIHPYQPRTDTRDVWQNYGVNSRGQFVPRVINTPYGYYYSRDMQPYPWAGSRPRAFVP